MRKILTFIVFLLIPIAVWAQDAADISAEVDDDKGFITRLLERNLSGAGRQVLISGFEGALSSRATFSEMTIADQDGIWITIRDGAIQWNRSALLRGRIEIAELSAGEILLPRLPGAGESAPKAETKEFALPDLPVSVKIDKIEAARVELGQPVIGIEAAFSVNGSMNLEGGEGTAALNVQRLDGPRGEFTLDAGFSNETRVLKFSLDLNEDANGLLVNLVDLYGKPSVSARISGEGPLSDFTADIELATDGQPRVTGKASAVASAGDDGTEGTAFRLELGGDVASLLPPENRTFFGPNTQLLADGWRGQDGRLDLPVLMIDTDALNLSGALSTNAQGAPVTATLMITLGADAGATELPVTLPFGGSGTTVHDGRLTLDYDASKGSGWTLQGRVGQISAQGVRINALTLDGAGQVQLDQGQMNDITGKIDFGANGVDFDDPGLAQAVGPDISGQTEFDFAPGNAIELSNLQVNGSDYGLQGDILIGGLGGGFTISGDVEAHYDDLSRMSTLAARDVSGSADASISGHYTVLTKGFYVEAEVTGDDIALSQEQLDKLLAGRSQIVLNARRGEDGIELSQLSINAQRLTAEAQGYLNSNSSDLKADISMPSLADLGGDFNGSLNLQASMNGAAGQRRLSISGEAQDLRVGIPELDGPLQGMTNLTVIAGETDGGYTVEQFALSNPQMRAAGEGSFAAGALDAQLEFEMPDLSVMGRGWSGGVSATATATEQDGTRFLDITGKGTDLRLGQENVDGALTGITDLAIRAEEKDGIITLRDVRLDNQQMSATASGIYGEGVTDLTASVQVASMAAFGQGWGGSLQLDGTLKDGADGARQLDVAGSGRNLSLGQAQLDGALGSSTSLTLRGAERGGVFTIDEAQIDSTNLSATATGQIGQGATDLTATLRSGNLRFLGRGFGGSISADARVLDQGGSRQITASGTANGLRIGQDKIDPVLSGQTSFDLAATQGDGGITLSRLQVRNPQLQVSADGNPATGLNIDARLSNLALIQPGFAGPVQVTGTVRQDGTNIDMNLSATAPAGTRAQATGWIAQDMSGSDLRISGVSDAALANPFLRTRSVEGPLNFDIRLQGRPSIEAITGQVSLVNARLADPRLGISMDSLNLTADLQNGRIMIDGGGNVLAGGQITVSGPVDIRTNTLDISVGLDNVVARDPNLYEVLMQGNVSISGSQAAGPLVSGTINIESAELRIPSTGLGGSTSIPDIQHVGDDQAVRSTRAKAGLEAWPSADAVAAGMTGPPATPPVNPPRLDLTINAPNRIFIRGRGVDAEMGGQMRITGTTRNVIPIGTLELIRGRVDLLGKRFVLTEGLIELQGSLVPVIRLVAETVQDEITTRIIIDGEARDPDITFEASPEMPQEEVLSQLLFGRGLANISPLQAAQLANAVAVLAGRGGEGIVGNLRSQFGPDDLDLATDDQGNVQVRAGKYLSENVYTDVSIGDNGKSTINLNLDISEQLRARGSVTSDGESKIGIYYEKDY